MELIGSVGEVCETQGEVTIQWKIKDFSSLSQEIDKYYRSPKFYFSGTSWHLEIFPNGETEFESGDWVGLYLNRASTGPPVRLYYSFSIKTENDKRYSESRGTTTFFQITESCGKDKYVLRTLLQEKKDELIPSDVLTLLCTLKCDKPTVIAGSLFNRYDELSSDMYEIYKKRKLTDVVVKVEDQEIPAHRMILEERSPVFAATFSHDMKEKLTGEISIADLDKSTLDVTLNYLYTGDVENLTTENVFPFYTAADKYDIKTAKLMCSEFITKNLSVDWVCDVIKFAKLHDDEKMLRDARTYFKENARKILNSEKWRIFAHENVDLLLELIGTEVMSLLPE